MPSIVRGATRMVSLLFAIYFCTNLLFKVNWSALWQVPFTGPLFMPVVEHGWAYTFIVWSAYITFIIDCVMQIKHMQYAYDISCHWKKWKLSEDVVWIPWSKVVEAMGNRNEHLLQRQMRLDNYLTAMSIENAMQIPAILYNQSLEWTLKQCMYASIFDSRQGPSSDIMVPANVDVFVRRFKISLWVAGTCTVVFMPVLTLMEIMKMVMHSLAMYQQDPTRFGHYAFTYQAMTEMRDFNELPHTFQSRLDKARPLVREVISVEMPTVMRQLMQLFEVISGSMLAFIVLIGLLNQSAPSSIRVWGQTLFFWAGIFGFVYISCRSKVEKSPLGIEDPEKKVDKLVKELHHVPATWNTLSLRGKFHEIHTFFRLSLVIQLGNVASTFCLPLFFLLWFPHKAEDIVRTMMALSVEDANLGVVCKYAVLSDHVPLHLSTIEASSSSSSSSGSSGLGASSDEEQFMSPMLAPTYGSTHGDSYMDPHMDQRSIRSQSSMQTSFQVALPLAQQRVNILRSSVMLEAKMSQSKIYNS